MTYIFQLMLVAPSHNEGTLYHNYQTFLQHLKSVLQLKSCRILTNSTQHNHRCNLKMVFIYKFLIIRFPITLSYLSLRTNKERSHPKIRTNTDYLQTLRDNER